MFGCTWDHFATALNSVQNGPNWCNQCKSSCHEVVSELFATNAPDPHHWTLNSCFVAFRKVGCIWESFATALNSVQNGPYWCKWCKSSCPEVASELFATNAPDPHHWTLNSCFVAFRKVRVHLGSFWYCTKLGAKWAELVQLMQKFMPRSRVGSFRYERARSTPLDSKLMFCCNFVKFGCIWDRFATALNSVQNGPNSCN